MNEVRAHVRLLAVLHYVLSGLAALFGLFPLIHVAVGIGILGGRLDGRGGPPPFLGWLFVGMGIAVILAAMGFAALLFGLRRWGLEGKASGDPEPIAQGRHRGERSLPPSPKLRASAKHDPRPPHR